MSVNKNYVTGGILLLVLSALFFFINYNSLYPFIYTELDDFYSYISIENSLGAQRKMVVPYGVFSVEKEGDWIHVIRVDVSIVSCGLTNGKPNEGTIYKNRQEYWVLNMNDELVFGPMNKAVNKQFLLKNGLKGKLAKIPESYSKYLNNFSSACE